MTDVTVAEAGEALPPKDLILTTTLKGGAGEITVNISQLPDETYQAIIAKGLEVFFASANGGTKAIAGVTKLEGAELAARQKEIVAAATKTKEQLEAGIVPGAKREKASGAVNTEAMRLAKNMVKDLIRNSGQKIGAYSAKEHTAAAKVVLERNPQLLKLAAKNIADRATEAKGSKALDLKGLFGAKAESDEVKAKPKVAPKRTAKGDKPPLSAKQAGMVAPKQKPGTATAH
jgi:hypothetical protein